MEVEIQTVEVKEYVLGYLANGVLGHLGKHCIAQLIEAGRSCTGNAIC